MLNIWNRAARKPRTESSAREHIGLRETQFNFKNITFEPFWKAINNCLPAGSLRVRPLSSAHQSNDPIPLYQSFYFGQPTLFI